MRFSASSFWDIWKVTFCDLLAFSRFWLVKESKLLISSDVLHKEKYILNLCLNMISVDAVDFSERRAEEVLSFFWRSVDIQIACTPFKPSCQPDILPDVCRHGSDNLVWNVQMNSSYWNAILLDAGYLNNLILSLQKGRNMHNFICLVFRSISVSFVVSSRYKGPRPGD